MNKEPLCLHHFMFVHRAMDCKCGSKSNIIIMQLETNTMAEIKMRMST